METRAAAVSPLYLLERFEPGIVHLGKQRHVIGMNDFARRLLPVDEKQPFNQMVLDFHPDRSRPKVEFLLDQAAQCPVAAPPPMTMIINIPERVLLIKVSRMSDARQQPTGYVLVFYDITDVVASKDETQPSRSDARRGDGGALIGLPALRAAAPQSGPTDKLSHLARVCPPYRLPGVNGWAHQARQGRIAVCARHRRLVRAWPPLVQMPAQDPAA